MAAGIKEMATVLGFNSAMFPLMREKNGTPRTPRTSTGEVLNDFSK